MRFIGLLILAIVASSQALSAQPSERQREYLKFIRAQANQMRAADKPPATREEWEAKTRDIRAQLQQAFGSFPKEKCPLEPKVLGVLKRDGYRVEKIIFQTMPGVWMTASAYVPDKPGKHPALLAVHGHWRGARLDPVLQKRCIGPAKLGYFVLAVDAFGAGERGLSKNLGEYHGEMVAATLLPSGLTLAGLQVYENMRAVDYLLTRPEVDGKKIAITGASGGGNQTMYAGAFDERFGAVVPVCSVGTYDAYLGTACCMCEVVPGALRFTEEGGILGLTAPRGLMVVNVTKDGIQFSIPEAKKSLAFASGVYKVFDKAESVRHTTFDWHHDYSQAMREALYGWLAKHLKGEGDGSPIADPPIKTEDPESLRCFPGQTRPAEWMTIPKFAAAEGNRLLAACKVADDAEAWRAESAKLRKVLLEKVLGGYPKPTLLQVTEELKKISEDDKKGVFTTFEFQSEPGIDLAVRRSAGKQKALAIVLDLDGAEKAARSPTAKALQQDGWSVLTVDLRATGALAWPSDKVVGAPDHNTAQWGLWIGRPLLGQWTLDVRGVIDAVQKVDGKLPERIALVGQGPAGVVALTAAALDARISHVVAVDSLASYVTDAPYKNQRLGLMAPGMLREVGDVAHLAALCLPRRVVIAGGVRGDGTKLSADGLQKTFEPTTQVQALLKAEGAVHLVGSDDPARVIKALR
ncbi:MAG: acetylxylan esterase [Gemmataceae bacterium]|nr:acetylxylan esterase [Gemmataceae bacterium]